MDILIYLSTSLKLFWILFLLNPLFINAWFIHKFESYISFVSFFFRNWITTPASAEETSKRNVSGPESLTHSSTNSMTSTSWISICSTTGLIPTWKICSLNQGKKWSTSHGTSDKTLNKLYLWLFKIYLLSSNWLILLWINLLKNIW